MFSEQVFLILWGVYRGVQGLSPMVTLFNFLRNCLISKVTAPFSTHPSNVQGFQLLRVPDNTCFLPVFLHRAIPTGVKWWLASLPVPPLPTVYIWLCVQSGTRGLLRDPPKSVRTPQTQEL